MKNCRYYMCNNYNNLWNINYADFVDNDSNYTFICGMGFYCDGNKGFVE